MVASTLAPRGVWPCRATFLTAVLPALTELEQTCPFLGPIVIADIYAYTEYSAILQQCTAIYSLGEISSAMSVDLRFDLARYSIDVSD